MLKNTKEITKKIFFPIIPMGAKRYIVVRVVKREKQVCVETDGQTDMARSTRLVMLIKNIYTLWGKFLAESLVNLHRGIAELHHHQLKFS